MVYQRTIISDSLSIGDTDNSVTVKLPRSNRIVGLVYVLKGTGGSGTPDIEELITKTEVVANGSSYIVDASNLQLRDISQMRNGGQRDEIVNHSGAASRVVTSVYMGRYKHDPVMCIPAYLFSSLHLKLTFDTLVAATAFATGTVELDVFCDEEIPDEDSAMDSDLFIKKVTLVEGFTSAASGDKKVELIKGHLIAALYLRAAGTDGTTISRFTLDLNNGSVKPITETWLLSQAQDGIEYKLANGKIPNVTMVDFDNPATEQVLDEVIDTSINSGVLAADIVLTQGAGPQECSVIQITYVPVESL